MAKPKVFVDSSCIIASLLSSKGGSFYILNTLTDEFEFQTNDYGLREIQEVFKSKFFHHPGLQTKLFLLLGSARVNILPNPSRRDKTRFSKYISANDAPILASAIKYCDYLLTLDNEFFSKGIIKLAESKGLTILKPKEFIQEQRKIKAAP